MGTLRHLSLSGPNAGIRVCGANDGDALHAAYLPSKLWRDESICMECVHVWAAEEDADEGNGTR